MYFLYFLPTAITTLKKILNFQSYRPRTKKRTKIKTIVTITKKSKIT